MHIQGTCLGRTEFHDGAQFTTALYDLEPASGRNIMKCLSQSAWPIDLEAVDRSFAAKSEMDNA